MRRGLIAAALLAGLLLGSATPALADRRKSTVTLGVDPDGVAIQVDATRSGDRRTAAGSGGGGGAPCTYTLASTGSAGLYVGKPADVGLFTVACGSSVDVRWLRMNPNGSPQVPGPTVDPFQLASRRVTGCRCRPVGSARTRPGAWSACRPGSGTRATTGTR